MIHKMTWQSQRAQPGGHAKVRGRRETMGKGAYHGCGAGDVVVQAASRGHTG